MRGNTDTNGLLKTNRSTEVDVVKLATKLIIPKKVEVITAIFSELVMPAIRTGINMITAVFISEKLIGNKLKTAIMENKIPSSAISLVLSFLLFIGASFSYIYPCIVFTK